MDRFILILAILPTVIMGCFIYKHDQIEKEPNKLLVKLLGAGLLAAFLTILLTKTLETIFPFFAIEDMKNLDYWASAVYVFFGIAIIEEFSKWLFTYIIAWKNKEFNHIYDAIVYSVFVSLGFATIENILYVFSANEYGMRIFIAIERMLFSVPGHAFFGVLMGYYLGLAKLSKINGYDDKCRKYLYYSVLVPAGGHFLFDYILMVNGNDDLKFLIFIIYVILLYVIAISKVKRLSKVPSMLNGKQPKQAKENKQNFNNITPPSIIPNYCSYCGTKVVGPYCTHCGHKNY